MTLVGNQEPTYLWHTPYELTLGEKAIRLYEASGGRLDAWQKLALTVAMAIDTATGTWLHFEVAIIVSRQNGKGEVLIALELAWLFLLGEKLITHSAHLFETSREHFLKIQAIILRTPAFKRRIQQIKEGRGSEEIILKPRHVEPRPTCDMQCEDCEPARLKFMTRKGGAGRGFTGGKVVFDEAMYLDADMIAAGVPTMATRPDAQLVYAGSAGMPHSTQLALARKRGLEKDRRIALLMWEAERAVYDENGRQIGGDDPADPRTHAKVNPAYGIRISPEYIADEAGAMGGYDSRPFAIERLGIGDYPIDGDRWEVIPKQHWKDAMDQDSVLGDGPKILGIDSEGSVTTLCVAGLSVLGRLHFEVIARHRGSAWLFDKLFGPAGEEHPVYGELDLWARLGKPRIACLKNGEAAEVAIALAKKVKDEVRRPEDHKVVYPSEMEYAAACGAMVEGIRTKVYVHIGQQSTEKAIAAAVRRENAEGGWRWDRDVPAEQAPIVGSTLATWGFGKYGRRRKSAVW